MLENGSESERSITHGGKRPKLSLKIFGPVWYKRGFSVWGASITKSEQVR